MRQKEIISQTKGEIERKNERIIELEMMGEGIGGQVVKQASEIQTPIHMK